MVRVYMSASESLWHDGVYKSCGSNGYLSSKLLAVVIKKYTNKVEFLSVACSVRLLVH